MLKVLMIVGSLRGNSFNFALAQEIQKIIGNRAEVSYLDYSDIPYMNQDGESPAPDAVVRVREEVKKADGIWICSPEYNGSIPGVLKNLLDWLSRPFMQGDAQVSAVVKGKMVTISSVAGKSAGSGVRANLAQVVEAMRMTLIGDKGTGITLQGEAFAIDSATFHDEDIKAIKSQVDEFLKVLAMEEK